MAAGGVQGSANPIVKRYVTVSVDVVIPRSLQTATAPTVQQLNPGGSSVLDKISPKLIDSDKVAVIKAATGSKDKDKISAIQVLFQNWKNQNKCKAKISYGFRQIVSIPLNTILSLEKLTSFEYDSYLLKERIDLMIVINSKNSNGDKLKELKDIKEKFKEFLNAVDSNNITDENRKQLCDYQNRIEYYPA